MTQQHKKETSKNKMTLFKITKIISSNTIETQWTWQEINGSKVQVRGINLEQYKDNILEAVKNRLETLLKDKKVALKSAEWINKGEDPKIMCDVYLNNINIAEYFDFK